VIGGTHLKAAAEEQIAKTVESLLAFDIQRLGVSHCTGPKAAQQLANAFGDRFLYCSVGTVLEL
jgi:7,8-dihydropterin-6-yl-methyl-4-(beta-D-ribofuranosyl)aminobenzene 5'-phosphate synthase